MKVRRVAEAIAGAVVLYFVGAYLAQHWGEIRGFPWRPSALTIVSATAAAAASLALYAALWRGVLGALGERVGLRDAAYVWFVSNLARYVPGKVWQLSGMAYLALRRGMRPVHALGASLLLQVLVLVTGAALVLAALPSGLPSAQGTTGLLLGLASAVLLGFYLSPLLDWTYARAAGLLRQPAPPARMSVATKMRFGVGTLVAWLLYGASFWLFLRGVVGGAPPFVVAVGVCAAGYLAGFLAFFTPGGLGVREGVYTLLLGPYLGPGVALSASLLVRVWLTLVELVLAGVAALVASRDTPADASRAAANAPSASASRGGVDHGTEGRDDVPVSPARSHG